MAGVDPGVHAVWARSIGTPAEWIAESSLAMTASYIAARYITVNSTEHIGFLPQPWFTAARTPRRTASLTIA